jgi:hypothetical protein
MMSSQNTIRLSKSDVTKSRGQVNYGRLTESLCCLVIGYIITEFHYYTFTFKSAWKQVIDMIILQRTRICPSIDWWINLCILVTINPLVPVKQIFFLKKVVYKAALANQISYTFVTISKNLIFWRNIIFELWTPGVMHCI